MVYKLDAFQNKEKVVRRCTFIEICFVKLNFVFDVDKEFGIGF